MIKNKKENSIYVRNIIFTEIMTLEGCRKIIVKHIQKDINFGLDLIKIQALWLSKGNCSFMSHHYSPLLVCNYGLSRYRQRSHFL